MAEEGFPMTKSAILSEEYDMFIFDEINLAIDNGLMSPFGILLHYNKILPEGSLIKE